VKKRKASECACIECTFVSHNLALVHAARPGWHRAKVQRIGGKSCVCHIHPPAGAAEGVAEIADELQPRSESWRAVTEEGGSEAVAEALAAEAAAASARPEAQAAEAMAQKARKYDSMTKSVEALTTALLPCGKVSYPQYSIIGCGDFRAFKKQCVSNNCEKRLWNRSEACSWESVFGPICPTENTDDKFSWFTWQKRLRGANEEGKAFYSLEWVPKHGTRKQFWEDMQAAVKENIYHRWREQVMRQGQRVYEDRKSGHHLVALRECKAALAAKSVGPATLSVFVDSASLNMLEPPAVLHPNNISRRWCTLCALARASADADVTAQLEAAESKVAVAQKVYEALSRTATVKSDYASQLETSRAYHTICAAKERHNYLVNLVCYRSTTHTRKRGRKTRPPLRASGSSARGRAYLLAAGSQQ